MTYVRFALSTALPPIRVVVSRMNKETVRWELENCHLLAGIWWHGLTVRQLQALRRSLPPTSKLIVAKNTVVDKAIAGTRWEPLQPCTKGMNAWLLVHSDELPPAIKPFRDFQREFELALNDFTGAVFEGRLYGPDDFEALETMPTRMESYAYLLGFLQTPSVALFSVLQSTEKHANQAAEGTTAAAASEK